MHSEVHALTKMTANKLARKWKQDRDDIAQELYLWIFEKLDYDFFYDLEDEPIDDEDYRQQFEEKVKRFRSSIYWAGERYCRQEKAAKEGYAIGDEYFYSAPQLVKLLAIYFTTGVDASPPKGRAESVKQVTDAAEGGGHLASMIDLENAYLKLSDDYRLRLWVRYGPLEDLSDESIVNLSQSEIVDRTGLHPEKMRSVLGVTKDQVRNRVKTAVSSLQKELGGPSPWRMGDYATAA